MDLGLSVGVKAVCPREGPMRKDLKGDDSVIAGCGIGRGRESMCQ